MRKPLPGAPGELILVIRYARRLDLDGSYRFDWHAPGTEHESPRAYRTWLGAWCSAWRFRRALRRVGAAEIIRPGMPQQPMATAA